MCYVWIGSIHLNRLLAFGWLAGVTVAAVFAVGVVIIVVVAVAVVCLVNMCS